MHFIYDCIQAFVKAREYLISQCEELRTIRSAGVLKEFLVNVKSGRYALGMNMRLAPDGRIIMMLSVADPLPKSIYNETSINLLEGRAWPIHKIYPPIGRSDTDIATFVAFNYRNRTENKLIQFQSILFSIGESYFSYIGRDDLKTIRGRRTVNWGGGIISYSNPLDFNPPIRIAPELVQQVGNSDILDFDIKGEWVRFAVPCSKSSSAVFEFTVKPDMRHLGNAWVSQMVYVYYLLGDKFKYLRYYGLPSVELLHPSYWTFSFQAEFINEKRRIVDVPSMIYLFVSFLTGAGGIVEPDWYWSWCGHGTERLSLRERLQVGIVGTPYLEASLKSERIVWPLSRLTAIECLHYSYGFRPNSRDAAKTLGLSIINLSSKERRRSQSVSADTARQTPGCRQRSYSESSRTNNEPTWLKRKKSAAENDYQAELRILHTYPSVSDDTIMVPNADFIFTKRGCHLPRIIKETRPFPMPKFFNS
ncbi:hypothetical protein BDQ17DRAFT_976095 [Cyathus striatus]|nr:hypothetical protein BDQ17DRAFT_976095 [Cyathus striatus]